MSVIFYYVVLNKFFKTQIVSQTSTVESHSWKYVSQCSQYLDLICRFQKYYCGPRSRMKSTVRIWRNLRSILIKCLIGESEASLVSKFNWLKAWFQYCIYTFVLLLFRCRTRILEQEDGKERERYLMKFIKVMKYLRKLNNFNSYLAILSALDSAPVRRLEWQKQNMEVTVLYFHWISHTVKLWTIVFQITVFTWLKHLLFLKVNRSSNETITEFN